MAARKIVVNAVNLPTTTHTYTGGGTTTTLGHDESWTTFHGTSGSGSHTIYATHTFATPRLIETWKYRIYIDGRAYGDDQADCTVAYNIEYTTNGTTWVTIASSQV